jgi:hypothetical protein
MGTFKGGTVHNWNMPMKLTITLVTQPSRVEFLAISLKAIREALHLHPALNLLVIFNGVSKRGEELLQPLRGEFEGRVSAEIIEKNTPLPNEVVKLIRKKELDWVHLPGDDDVVIPETYNHFFDSIEKNPENVAFGFSAIAIDSDERPTGKILNPINTEQSSKESLLAGVLHKPIFVWPSLIFNFKTIPENIFSSRFVFDWWVGFQLLLAGPITNINLPLIKYRVHDFQESSLAPETRKRFEAEIMIQSVIVDKQFQQFLENLKNQQLFYQDLGSNLPVYGDSTFGTSIYLQLLNSSSSAKVVNVGGLARQLASFASAHGAYLMMSEFPGRSSIFTHNTFKLNLSGVMLERTCTRVIESLNRTLDFGLKPTYAIGCLHSVVSETSQAAVLQIDCENFEDVEDNSIDQAILLQLERQLTGILRLESQLAPWEKRLIEISRKALEVVRSLKSFFRRR